MARDNELSFIISVQDQASKHVKKIEQTLNRLNKTVVSNIRLNATADTRPFKAMERQYTLLEKAQGKLISKQAQVSASLAKKPPDDLAKWATGISTHFTNLGKAALIAGKVIGAAFGIGVVASIAAIGMGLYKLGKQTIDINSQLETFATSLRTTLGSLAAAKKEMADIVEFARTTPYEIAGVTDAFVKLRAYALDPKKWAVASGDMAAAFGKPMIKAVEAIADATRGEFKRMREFGFVFHVNDFKKGGRYAGETYADAIFEAISGRFKGGMALQAQTYAGIVSNLKDTITIAIAQAGQPIFSYVKKSAGALLAYFDTLKSSGALDEYIARFKRSFQQAQEVILNVVDYIKTNWIPALISIAKNGAELAGTLIKAFGPTLLKSLLSIITVVLQIAAVIMSAMNAAQAFIKVLIYYKIATTIFGMLGINIMGATRAVIGFGAASTEASMAAAAAAKRFALVAVAMAAFAIFAKSTDFKNSVNEITKNMNGMMDAETVKKNVDEIAKSTGYSMNEVAKAMATATEYGARYIEITKVASKDSRAYGMSLQDTVRMIGDLGKAFGIAGGEYERFSSYVYDLIQSGKEFSFDSDQLLDTLKEYPDVLHNVVGGYEGMIAMAKEAGKQHVDLGKILAAGDLMRTPSTEMLIGGTDNEGKKFEGINPTAWATRSIKDASDFSKVWDTALEATADGVKRTNEQAKALQETWDALVSDVSLSGLNLDDIIFGEGNDFEKNIKVIAALDKEATKVEGTIKNLQSAVADQTAALTELTDEEWETAHMTMILQADQAELEKQLKSVNREIADLEKELKKLAAVVPTGTNAFNRSMEEMSDAIAVLELKGLQIELDQVNNSFDEQEKTIKRLTRAIEDDKASLEPLQDELKSLEDQFSSISDAISKAQEDLDKFTNPKLEGMGAFDDQIHGIDMQLNQLQRNRLDAAEGLGIWERLGLTDTDAYKRASQGLEAIDKQIAGLEDSKSRLELDRSIAYDDQLYQLGKMADTEEEITFEAAVAGATAAKNQIAELTAKLAAVRSSKDALTEEIKLRQDSLDAQQKIVDEKQRELDIAKEIAQNIVDENEQQKKRLSLVQQIRQAEWDISQTQFNRDRERITNPLPEEIPPGDILARTNAAQGTLGSASTALNPLGSGLLGDTEAIQRDIDMHERQIEAVNIDTAQRAIDIDTMRKKLETSQLALDENTNTLEKLRNTMKDLTTATEALIIGIDFKNLSKAQTAALEQAFGKDFVTDMVTKAMAAGGEQPKGSPGAPGTPGAPPEKGAGFWGTIGATISNLEAAHPWLVAGLAGAAGVAAYKGGPKVIKAGAGAVGRGLAGPLGRFGTGLAEFSDEGVRGSIKRLPVTVDTTIKTMRSQMGLGGKKGIANAPKLEKTLATMFESLRDAGVPQEKLDELRKGIEKSTKLAKNAPNEGIAKIAGNKRSTLFNEVEDLFRGTMWNINKGTSRAQRAGRYVADRLPEVGRRFITGQAAAAEAAVSRAKMIDELTDAADSGNKAAQKALKILKSNPGITSEDDLFKAMKSGGGAARTATEEVGENVARRGLGTRRWVGALGNIPLISAPIRQMRSALFGGGNPVSRYRSGAYGSAQAAGTIQQVWKGEGVKRVFSVVKGRVAGALMRGKGAAQAVKSALGGSIGVVAGRATNQAGQLLDDEALRRGSASKLMRLPTDFIRRGASQIYDPSLYPSNLAGKLDVSSNSVNQMVADIQYGKKKGIRKPLEMTVDKQGRMLLNEGHHRLAAAEQLGLKELPVSVTKETTESTKFMQKFLRKTRLGQLPNIKELGAKAGKFADTLIPPIGPADAIRRMGTAAKEIGGIGKLGASKVVDTVLNNMGKGGIRGKVADVAADIGWKKLPGLIEKVVKLPGLKNLLGESGTKVAAKALARKAGSYILGAPADILTGSIDLSKLIRKIPGWDKFMASGNNPLTKALDFFREKMSPEMFLQLTDPIQKFGEGIMKLYDIVNKAFDVVMSFFGALFKWDWAGFKDNVAGLWDAIKGFFGKLKEFGEEVLGAFGAVLGAIPDTIKAPFIAAWDWISGDDGPKGWAVKIWDILASIGTKIGEKAADVVGWFSGVFGGAWTWVKDHFTWWPDKLWELVAGIGTLLVNKAGDVVGWFKDLFSAAWDWISGDDGPKGWPTKIWEWIKSIPEKLGNLGQDFLQAGKDLIGKLVEGFTAAWDTVKDLPGVKQVVWVIDKTAGALGSALSAVNFFDEGGISRGPNSGHLEMLHGTEAVIPLKNGYIPVKITGENSGGGGDTYTTNIETGAFNIVVRDDADMEEVKKILLSLQKGTFRDSPYNYPQGY